MVDKELKKQVEAVLFAIGKKISVDEISRICNASQNDVTKALKELADEYNNRDSSLIMLNEGNFWNLTIREKYIPLVKNINPHTELTKQVIETLAVIAWKAPVLQSDVVRTRTTNAYEHIHELVDSGFITKQKHGRSYILRLAPKFFEYFDLKNENEIKEKFKDFKDIIEPTNTNITTNITNTNTDFNNNNNEGNVINESEDSKQLNESTQISELNNNIETDINNIIGNTKIDNTKKNKSRKVKKLNLIKNDNEVDKIK